MGALPRGTSDLNPEESILMKNLNDTIQIIYQMYGFYPLETPSIELLETLTSKAYGDENAKEIYKIEGGIEGLRYDLTVSLARYISMNKDIVFPFKRYQIGKVWRMDEPQKMREREFYQADIDIVGNTDITAEAELISATDNALYSVGIKNSSILINSRVILNGILESFNIKEETHAKVIRVLDKMQKIGKEETKKQIVNIGIDEGTTTELLELVLFEENNLEKISELETRLKSSKEELEKLSRLLELLKTYNLKSNVLIDLSLARGMDYYTGLVWEFVVLDQGKRLPTIASGGRYDKLIGTYLKRDIPAVGSSIGMTRVFELLKNTENKKTYALVYISYIGRDNLEYAVYVAGVLRKNRIPVDINLLDRGITKQLNYANSLKIPYVIILGNMEKTAKKIKIRDMSSGNESMIELDEVIQLLKTKTM